MNSKKVSLEVNGAKIELEASVDNPGNVEDLIVNGKSVYKKLEAIRKELRETKKELQRFEKELPKDHERVFIDVCIYAHSDIQDLCKDFGIAEKKWLRMAVMTQLDNHQTLRFYQGRKDEND